MRLAGIVDLKLQLSVADPMPSVLNDSVTPAPFLPNLGMPDLDTVIGKSAEELCDDLMLHTFECDQCINGQENSCPTFCCLREKIAQEGGVSKGIFLSM